MTDPEIADATYIEPVDWQTLEKIIEKEKPDAILANYGWPNGFKCFIRVSKKRNA